MKKILILLFVLLAMASTINAQTISREVISNAGGTLSGGGSQITFTIGEMFIPSLGGAVSMTQGFQQPGEQIRTGSVAALINAGSSFDLPYTATDIGGGNTFIVQLSDATGSFANPVNIGSLSGNASAGVINAMIPSNVIAGTEYRIRITSSSPAFIGTDNGANIKINTPPVIAALPSVSTISCPATPSFAIATATNNNGSLAILTFADVKTNGACAGSYAITRTWTATDTFENTSTASQTINVEDKTGPVTSTAFNAIVNVNCDAIPVKPELVFVDNCSTVATPVYSEKITNKTATSYSIEREWNVADTCGNSSKFIQVVNVTVVGAIIRIASAACNSDESLTVNLNSLLPAGSPTNGTWIDVNNSGGLQSGTLSPFNIPIGDYTFEYRIDDSSCPRSVFIDMNINSDCGGIVLGCGTVLVHNAFSPNGDAVNETFIIDNIDDVVCYPENSVEIYNRWGAKVYETKNYNNTTIVFDGTSQAKSTVSDKSGLPTGTYFYILNYTSVDGNGKIQTNTKNGYLYLSK
jgi:gliding motility-associated-like protein